MNIPNDPIMLLSVVNTALRDHYKSFDDMVLDNALDGQTIMKKLAAIDYHYDKQLNQFK